MATSHPSKQTRKARGTTPSRKAPKSKARRATASKHGVLADPATEFTGDEWYEMVATAAYFRAESRGFEGGLPEDDWYEAEAELREQLASAEDTFDANESQQTTRGDNERENDDGESGRI